MVRIAKIRDVPEIVKLVNYWAERGQMLARPLSQVYTALRDYVVIEKEGKVVGCGALHVVWNDIGEIRTLAIDPGHVGTGLGREIVDHLLNTAVQLELPRVFTLTYKPGFFGKMGFVEVDKKELPHKVWKDCLDCPKFPDCDEIAMARDV